MAPRDPQGQTELTQKQFEAILSALRAHDVTEIYSAVTKELGLFGSHLMSSPYDVPTKSEMIGFVANILANPQTANHVADRAWDVYANQITRPRGSWEIGREKDEYSDLMAPQTDEEERSDNIAPMSFSPVEAPASLSFASPPTGAALTFKGDAFGGINVQHSAVNALTVSLSETGAFSVNSDGTITNAFGQTVAHTADTSPRANTTPAPADVPDPDPGI